MNVQMVDGLGSVDSIVNDDAKAIGAFGFSHLTGHQQQVSQQESVIVILDIGLAQLRQSAAIFGNDQDMHGRGG